MDLRKRVVAAVKEEGLSRHEAAARFVVAISTAINWVKRFQERGSIEADRIGGHKPKKIVGDRAEWLRQGVVTLAFGDGLPWQETFKIMLPSCRGGVERAYRAPRLHHRRRATGTS